MNRYFIPILTIVLLGSSLLVSCAKEDSTHVRTQTPSPPDTVILKFKQLKLQQLAQLAIDLSTIEGNITDTEAEVKRLESLILPYYHRVTPEEIVASLSLPGVRNKLADLKEQRIYLLAKKQYLEQDIQELKQYNELAKYFEFKQSQLDDLTSRLIVLRIDIDQGTASAQQEYNRLLPQRKFMQQDIEELKQLHPY